MKTSANSRTLGTQSIIPAGRASADQTSIWVIPTESALLHLWPDDEVDSWSINGSVLTFAMPHFYEDISETYFPDILMRYL